MDEKNLGIIEEPESKTNRRTFLKSGIVAAGATLLGATANTKIADATDQTQDDMQDVQFLFVQTAENVDIQRDRITLMRINPTTIFFSDRPKRIAGHMATDEFVLDWQEAKGKDSFASDPPNAALSIFGENEIVDIVIELKMPQLSDKDLTYDIVILDQEAPIISGPCSLFIDPVGMPLSPTSVAGVHRRHRRHVRRRHAVIR